MRLDATSPTPSPFSAIPEVEWLCANDLSFAIDDNFPVSPGHVLVITRRVVPTYFDCTAAEQAAVMELVGEVKRLLDERLAPKPDGYNVGFNAGAAAGQTVPHVHVHGQKGDAALSAAERAASPFFRRRPPGSAFATRGRGRSRTASSACPGLDSEMYVRIHSAICSRCLYHDIGPIQRGVS